MALALISASIFTVSSVDLFSDPYTWVGGTSAWSLNTNWNPTTGPPGAGDDAFFDLGVSLVIDTGILSIGSIDISSTVNPGDSVTLQNGSIAFSTGSISTSVEADYVITSTVSVATSGTLNVSTANANDVVDFQGVISGDGSLSIGGNGTVLYSADNTYLGTTTIGGGTLSISSAARVGGGGDLILNGGTLNITSTIASLPNVLNVTGTSTLNTNANNVTSPATNTGAGDFTKTGSGTLTLTGDNSGLTAGFNLAGGLLQLENSNNLAGTADLIFNGGNLTVTTADISTGRALFVVAPATITVDNLITLTLSGNFGSGSAAFTKEGEGGLVLSGDNSLFTGTFSFDAGTVRIDGASSIAGTAPLIFDGATIMDSTVDVTSARAITLTQAAALGPDTGTTLNLTGDFGTGAGELTMAGSGTVVLSGDNTNFTGDISLENGTLEVRSSNSLAGGGAVTFNTGPGQTFSGTTAADITLSNIFTMSQNGIFNVDSPTTLTLSGNFGIASGTIEKTGDGVLFLTGDNSNQTGNVTISEGTLQIEADNNIANAAQIIVSGGILRASETFSLTNAITTDVTDVEIAVADTKTLTLGTVFPVSSTWGLTKSDTGTLILPTANNNYSGTTTISAGTLQIPDDSALGSGGVTLNGGTLNTTTTESFVNVITIGASGGTIDVDNLTTLTQTQPFGAGSVGDLTKSGEGTLQLTQANTNYSGTTTLSNGTTNTFNIDALNSGALVMSGDAALVLEANLNISDFTGALTNTVDLNGNTLTVTPVSGSTNFQGVISGTGNLTKAGGQTLILTGANDYTATTTLNLGGLTISGLGTIGASTAPLVVNGGVFDLSASLSTTYDIGNLSGTGGVINCGTNTLGVTQTAPGDFAGTINSTLTNVQVALEKKGASTLTLSGTNSYVGITSLQNGTLSISSANNLGGEGLILFDASGGSATLNISADIANLPNNVTISNTTSTIDVDDGFNANFTGDFAASTGTLVKAGGGTLQLSGDNSNLQIPVTITVGNLSLDSVNALSGITGLTLDGGTLQADTTLTVSAPITISQPSIVAVNGSISDILTLSGDIGASTDALTIIGGGITALRGDNTAYEGVLSIDAGYLSIVDATNVPNGGEVIDLYRNSDQDSVFSAGTAPSIELTNVFNFINGSGGGGIAIIEVDGSTTLTLSGAFATSDVPFTKSGAGVLALNANNIAHNGTITVSEGTLRISNANNLSGGQNVTLDGGTFNLSTTDASLTAVFTLSGDGTVDVDTGLTLTLSSDMGTGTGTLTKSDAGALVLSGSNTNFTGPITLTGGTLQTENANNLQGTGALTFNGGSLAIETADVSSTMIPTFTSGGTITVGTGRQLTLSGDFATSTQTLTKAGAGILVLSGANSDFTGPITLTGGTLQTETATNLQGSNALTFNGGNLSVQTNAISSSMLPTLTQGATITTGANLTLSGDFATSTQTLTKAGAGTLTLSGDNTNFTGAITVSAGTLQTASANNLQGTDDLTFTGGDLDIQTASVTTTMTPVLTNAASINVASGLTLALDGAFGVGAATLTKTGPGILDIGTTSASYTGDISMEGGTLTCSNANSLAGSGGLIFNGGNLSASTNISTAKVVTMTQGGTISVGNTLDLTLSGDFATSSGTLTVSGSGDLILSGTNTNYSGDFILTGTNAVLRVASNDNLGSGNITFSDGNLEVTGDITTARTVTFQTGTFGTIGVTNGADTLTLSGNFGAGNGTLTTRASHAGTLELSGNNSSYTGAIIFNGPGTLLVSSANGIGTAGGLLTFNNASSTLDIAEDVTSSRQLGMSTAGTLNVATTKTFSISGDFQTSSGTLTKTGAGTFDIAGDSTDYSGTISVNAGLLRTSDSNALAGSGGLTFNGGNLEVVTADVSTAKAVTLSQAASMSVDTGITLTLSGDITSVSDTLTKAGAGNLILSGDNSGFTGSITMTGGTLQTSSSNNLSGDDTKSLTFNGGNLSVQTADVATDMITTLTQAATITTGSNLTLNGDFAPSAQTLTKEGAGTLTLGGTNTNFTGDVNLNTGTIAISSADNFSNGGGLTFNGGTLQATNNIADLTNIVTMSGAGTVNVDPTFSATISSNFATGSGNLTKSGEGTLILSGSNGNYSGTTLITNGSLEMSSANALGTGAVTMSGDGDLTLNNSATIGTLSGTGTPTIDTQPGVTGFTLTISQAVDGEFAGVISGDAGGIRTEGNGVLTLSGANTYGGLTDLGGAGGVGGITLSGAGTLGDGTGPVNMDIDTNLTIATGAGNKSIGTFTAASGSIIALNDNTLTITQSADTQCASPISGTGGITVAGTNVLTLSAANSYSGTTNVTETSGLTLTGSGTAGDGTSDLVVDANATFTIAALAGDKSIGNLTGSGSIVVNENTLTINEDAGGGFGGIISGTNGGITKNGAAQLIFTGANSYTGTTTLADGNVILDGGTSALGNGANLTMQGDASLAISDSAGTKTVGTLIGTSGNAITLNTGSGLTVTQASNQTYAGTFDSGGTLTKAGGSNLILSGDNSGFDGDTALTAGTLTLSNANALSNSALTMSNAADLTLTTASQVGGLAGAGTNTVTLDTNVLTINETGTSNFAGTISGSGSAGVIKTGAGTTTFSGDNSGYPGPTTLTNGTLSIGAANNIGTGQLVMNGGTLNVNTTGVDLTNVVNVNSASTINAGTNIAVTLSTAFATATENLTKSGSGTLILSGNNSNYTGSLLLSAGTARLSNANALSSSPVTMSGTANLDVATNATIKDLTGVDGNTVTLNGNNLTINQAGTSTFGGVISSTSDVTLTKSGTGTLTLANTNDYTGTAMLTAGETQLSGANSALGNNVDLTLTNGGGDNTVLTLVTDAGSKSIGNLVGAANTVIALNNNTLTINQSGAGIYAGGITGSAGSVFNKAGTATLTLTSASNLSTGTVNITDGSLLLSGASSALVSGALNISAGKNLTLEANAGDKTIGDLGGGANSSVALNNNGLTIVQSGNSTFSGVVSGTGAIIKSGNGTLTLEGANNYTGDTNISAGEVVLSGASSALGNTSILSINNTGILTLETGAGAKTIGSLSGDTGTTLALNNNTLSVTQTTQGGFSGTITGVNGGLTKLGSAALGLTGANTYSGATTITAGSLGVTGSINNSTVTVGENGTLLGTGSTGTVINNGSVTPGASIGTLTINGNYTQDANASLEIEVDQNGNTDLLQVTGTANLDGTVQVVPATGIYPEGTTFTFLNAAAINGTFSTITQPSDFSFDLRYTATTVSLFLTQGVNVLPVPISQLLGNPRRVADYISANGFVPTSGDIFYTLDNLEGLSAEDYQVTLIKLSPLIFGALPLVNLQSDTRLADTFTRSFKRSCEYRYTKERKKRFYFKREKKKEKEIIEELNQECPKQSVWAEPIFYFYNQQNSGGRITNEGQPAFTSYTYGTSAGWNDFLGENWAAGLGIGYTHSSIYWEKGFGYGYWNTLYLAPSFGWASEKGYANLIFESSFNFYKMNRKIDYASIRRKASHRSNCYDMLARIEGGMRLQKEKSKYSLEPKGKFGVITMISDPYVESGAKSLNLSVRRKHITYFETEFLLKGIRDFYFKKAVFSPALYAGWVAYTPATNGNITAKFAEQNTNRAKFHVLSYHQMINQMVLGCDLPIQNYKSFSFKVNYETSFFNHFQIQEVSAKFNWDF